MPIDFPTGPSLNQTYTYSGRTWKWNGEGWALTSDVAVPVTSIQGLTTSTADPSGGNDGDIWIKYTA